MSAFPIPPAAAPQATPTPFPLQALLRGTLSSQKDGDRWVVSIAFGSPKDSDAIYDWLENRPSEAEPPIPPAVVEGLVEALEIIAGKRQCIDNLMSNADIAHAALSKLPENPVYSSGGVVILDAVVEAMARAMWGYDTKTPWDKAEHLHRSYRERAQAALSAALATGSVVICAPEMHKRLEAAEGWKGHHKGACAYSDECPACQAYAKVAYNFAARAHQEDKG